MTHAGVCFGQLWLCLTHMVPFSDSLHVYLIASTGNAVHIHKNMTNPFYKVVEEKNWWVAGPATVHNARFPMTWTQNSGMKPTQKATLVLL